MGPLTGILLPLGARYNIALLLFFVPYALLELPSNVIIRRIGARIWLRFLAIGWGACILGMGFVRHWVPLAVLRILLGAFEAGRESSIRADPLHSLMPHSIPGGGFHYLIVVPHIRDREASFNLLHGLAVCLWIQWYCESPSSHSVHKTWTIRLISTRLHTAYP